MHDDALRLGIINQDEWEYLDNLKQSGQEQEYEEMEEFFHADDGFVTDFELASPAERVHMLRQIRQDRMEREGEDLQDLESQVGTSSGFRSRRTASGRTVRYPVGGVTRRRRTRKRESLVGNEPILGEGEPII